MGLQLLVGFLLGLLVVKWVLRNLNRWFCEWKLGDKKYDLPPGDYGWPFIGNMWSFLKAFKSNNPESFISSFVYRFGRTGLYNAHKFGNPSIIVTTAEACRKVLTDYESFKPGWPSATRNLIGRKSFITISDEDHRWLRKLMAAQNVVIALEKWSKMGQVEFLTELRRLTFRIIMNIFLSLESEPVMEVLDRDYTVLNYRLRAMAINIPGFAYHNALKARKRLVAVLQGIVTKRRERRQENPTKVKNDMMDALLEAKDENGRTLTDEEIIDVLLMYLNAGHESSGHITMRATLLIQKHPEVFKKAKAEQEEVVKNMPSDHKGLTVKETRQIEYLSKVIDETLRLITIAQTAFREAKRDVNVCGYMILKGWKVMIWCSTVHFDPQTYPEPMKFDPFRWDGFTPKAENFLPFGAGSRLCPGNDLAKLEISIFLHHFLLNYELEQQNPDSPLIYLPHTRPKDTALEE